MKLHTISPAKGSKQKKKRVGRGPGSGLGKTAGRGHKGQKSRAGGFHKVGFEGGQMPLQRRLPKRGFHNIFKKRYAILNLKQLATLGEATVSPELLLQRGVVKNLRDGLKILGEGELKQAMTVRAHHFSQSAREKIMKAGGTVELLEG